MGNAATKEAQQQQRSRASSLAGSSSPSNNHRGGSRLNSSSSTLDPDDILNFSTSATSSRRRRASSSANASSSQNPHINTNQQYHRKGKSKKHQPPPEPVQILVLDPSETVDGGYLQPQGVYTGPQDFKYKVVRQLIIDRKIAPFYKGLNDYKDSWTDRQLLAAVRGLPILEDNTKKSTEGSSSPPIIQQLPDVDNVTTTTSQNSFSSSGSLAIPSVSTASTSLDLDVVPASVAEDLVDSPDAIIPLMPATSSSAPSHSFMQKEPFINDNNQLPSNYPSLTPLPHAHLHHQAYKDFLNATTTTTNIPTTTTPSSPSIASPSSSPVTRSRANTTSRYGPSPLGAPVKPPLEVLVYRGAIECPICFLYYPKYLNLTRCCAQPICTECFVQIKRPDPHPPHDDHENTTTPQNILAAEPMLVSEPACCPYCMIPDFGVTYTPSPYRSGLEPKKQHSAHGGVSTLLPLTNILSLKDDSTATGSTSALDESAVDSSPSPGSTPASSTSALSSTLSSHNSLAVAMSAAPTKRRGSIPANSPDVVTIDRIRPDWSIKLAAARAHAARKAAQATALHASAFLLDNQAESGSGGSRSRGSRGSRGLGGSGGNRRRSSAGANSGRNGGPSAEANNPRIQQLEDIMVMEAIRLSLIEEESRKLKEQQATADSTSTATSP